ncbi:DHH family phosphoesterase [Candidatus Pacearchaeota archaeon]|nr:DHH family phosphoesterase [Candidatus Pacearchaeota archaeon]
MLTEKQINEIKEHLERAQNPVFYYDNDADGLCSFVILRKFIGRGKGVAIRSFPDLNASYAKKAQELNADYIFILDKPVLSKEFVEEILKLGLPLVWIDHHDVKNDFEGNDNFFIYNPAKNTGKDKSEEPVTYLCYKIIQRKEDVWLAIVGCIADHYLPEFFSEFKERYPELWGDVKDPFDAYYKTEIGRIAQGLNFGLKDSTTHIVKLQNFLISCKTPREVFLETSANYTFREKYREVKKKYDALVEKAKKNVRDKLIFFEYAGDLSISSDIANQLSYFYPNKYVVVVYKKGNVANISMRGKNVREILDKVLKEVEGSGGGHENAVGARISTQYLEKFKELLEREIKDEKN